MVAVETHPPHGEAGLNAALSEDAPGVEQLRADDGERPGTAAGG